MIIKTEADVTKAVLEEMARAENPRTREILTSMVKHLHSFIRETKLTEVEFHQAAAYIAALGKHTTESHNETVLMAGSLGISQLVCLLNNTDGGTRPTSANLLGPFWRPGSPATANGGSLVRCPTEGTPLFVKGRVVDPKGKPVAGAEIDVWHCNDEGYYENQDPGQADMNLRGKLTTDAEGRVWFRTIKPIGYPAPVDGPVGDLTRTLKRHNLRPAHVHFLIVKEGYKVQPSQVYWNDDPHLDSDMQFGVTEHLVGNFVLHESGTPPAPDVKGPWYTLDHEFVVEPGETRLPRAPISGKNAGERPVIEILHRA
jgi:hydroxyquinol 1,2-dioxygenase